VVHNHDIDQSGFGLNGDIALWRADREPAHEFTLTNGWDGGVRRRGEAGRQIPLTPWA
jgi:hypothetical protein